ncbi:MAG: sigma-70 family RNA polymerase sigma factor [Muribaculaceae bacterium]|nr:sigma-70 family RNA polymerase sigma factor [Muribaculaceae bacterium]
MTHKDFEILAATLRPRLLRTARLITRDDMEAEDVVQDTMLKLWTIRTKLDECRSVEALATVITRRLSLNVLRRNKPGTSVDITDDLLTLPSAEEELINRQETGRVDMIMAALPEAAQTLLRLRHIEGYDNASIAAILGCSEGAVRTALSRARQRVAKIFNLNSL